MGSKINRELLLIFLEDANDSLDQWEKVCLKLQPSDNVSAMEPLHRFAHNLKGGAGLIGLQPMYQSLHRFEDFMVQIRDRGMSPSGEVVSALLALEKFFRGWLDQLKTDPDVVPDGKPLEEVFQGLLSRSPVQAPAQSEESAERVTPRAVKAQPASDEGGTKSDETLRVSANRLDHLVQLVGEMSSHQAILDRASREGTLDTIQVRNVISIKNKLTQDLQNAVLALRMIPVDALFQKVERVARETATQLRKMVTVIRRGDDVTLDKVVVERMMDPLIHLTRNAIDHGIETVEERIEQGKRPQGFIRITAENTTSGVTLVFEDDGRGIDAEKVYRKAMEKGLIAENTELTTAAKLNLIFLPGLSTAEQVSEISGRGVGMDIVADTVTRMGGRIDVDSVVGDGTRIAITLPTNLSILDALVVKVSGCQYAIPNQDLAEVINLDDVEVHDVQAGRGQAINLRGRIVPIEDMSHLLQSHDHRAITPPSLDVKTAKPGIIVQFREDTLAFKVDSVVGQQQIFVRPLIESLAPIGFYGGSTILSDGEPSIILNLSEMARHYFESNQANV